MAALLKWHYEKHSYLNVNKACLDLLSIFDDNINSKVIHSFSFSR